MNTEQTRKNIFMYKTFLPNLSKNGVPIGHSQNKKQFFSEITKPDPKLSKPYYFNKILYVLTEL